jgi:hypothetical protein
LINDLQSSSIQDCQLTVVLLQVEVDQIAQGDDGRSLVPDLQVPHQLLNLPEKSSFLFIHRRQSNQYFIYCLNLKHFVLQANIGGIYLVKLVNNLLGLYIYKHRYCYSLFRLDSSLPLYLIVFLKNK